MSEEFEHAHENLEHAAHGHSHGESKVKPTAIIIGVMAAALAITEFAAKDAQTSYLSNHIAASDTWAQYQAKSVRRAVLSSEADVLESLPGAAANPALQKADRRRTGKRRAHAFGGRLRRHGTTIGTGTRTGASAGSRGTSFSCARDCQRRFADCDRPGVDLGRREFACLRDYQRRSGIGFRHIRVAGSNISALASL